MTNTVLLVVGGCLASWATGFLFGKVIKIVENFFTDAI